MIPNPSSIRELVVIAIGFLPLKVNGIIHSLSLRCHVTDLFPACLWSALFPISDLQRMGRLEADLPQGIVFRPER